MKPVPVKEGMMTVRNRHAMTIREVLPVGGQKAFQEQAPTNR
jgi:hypothetical protein